MPKISVTRLARAFRSRLAAHSVMMRPLALLACLTLALVVLGAPRAGAEPYPVYSSLAQHLLGAPNAVVRDDARRPVSVFGVPPGEARMVFYAVTRDRALPEGYVPPDLARYGGKLVREIVLADARAMLDAAERDGVDVAVVSGYRSPAEQVAAFESALWRTIARSGGAIDRAEAEARTSRFVAKPGHSQHQLGTAIDFSTWEIDYAVQPRFAETAAGAWLAERAWEYGFVLPYGRDQEHLTGYAYEPWHWRWVGRPLAAVMQRDGYLNHPTRIADDYLRAVEEVLDTERVP